MPRNFFTLSHQFIHLGLVEELQTASEFQLRLNFEE
jgi:hypothetical protein